MLDLLSLAFFFCFSPPLPSRSSLSHFAPVSPRVDRSRPLWPLRVLSASSHHPALRNACLCCLFLPSIFGLMRHRGTGWVCGRNLQRLKFSSTQDATGGQRSDRLDGGWVLAGWEKYKGWKAVEFVRAPLKLKFAPQTLERPSQDATLEAGTVLSLNQRTTSSAVDGETM